MHICIYIYIYVYMYSSIYIYTSQHTHTHNYMHVILPVCLAAIPKIHATHTRAVSLSVFLSRIFTPAAMCFYPCRHVILPVSLHARLETHGTFTSLSLSLSLALSLSHAYTHTHTPAAMSSGLCPWTQYRKKTISCMYQVRTPRPHLLPPPLRALTTLRLPPAPPVCSHVHTHITHTHTNLTN